jgi:energy-coupling factor transporter ATP-binding protein EcfA2
VLVVSHDLDFCFEALDRVVLMRDGGIILDNTWNALDEAQLAALDDIVDLPQALQAVKALGPTADAELRALLISAPELKRDT